MLSKNAKKQHYLQVPKTERRRHMEAEASPLFNLRRTQSCRTPRASTSTPRKNRCSRSKSQRRGALGSLSSLTFSQRQALSASWRLLKPQANALWRKILLELEVVSPKVKQIFYKAALVDAFNKDEENLATLEAHLKMITRFLDEVMSSLEDEAECVEKIKKIGQTHAILARTTNFTGDIWEQLGEIAMSRICTHEAVQKTREAQRAWRMLLACVVDELRQGFDEEVRLNRKPSSTIDREDIEEVTCDRIHQMRLDFEASYE